MEQPKSKPAVKILPLSSLSLDEQNANRGSERGRKMLEDSLRKLGAGRSVLVDREGRVIAGNKTVETARKLGLKQIAVIETDGETLVAVRRRDLILRPTRRRQSLPWPITGWPKSILTGIPRCWPPSRLISANSGTSKSWPN